MKSSLAVSLFSSAVAAVVIAGCTSSAPTKDAGAGATPTDTKGTSATTPKSDMLIGLVFDKGGLGDKSFNDSANRGLVAAEQKLGIKGKTVDSKSDSEYETNLEALADGGANLVIGVGISMQSAVEAAAKKYPNVKFAIVDAPVDQPNVRSLVFTEEQGSFLAGYLAGLTTKSNKIGFVGGMEIPLIKKFEYGYEAGAFSANPKVQFLAPKYTGDWVNVDLGKASANALYTDGADVVYAAAGRAGLGVISAAGEAKKFAIGVDSDQDDLAQGYVLTSMIKHVDVAVEKTIEDLVNGKFTAGTQVYDLKVDGVGLSEMKYTKDKLAPDALTKLEKVKQDIIAGKIKVPSTEAEFKSFTTPTTTGTTP